MFLLELHTLIQAVRSYAPRGPGQWLSKLWSVDILDFQVLFPAKNAAHQSKFGCDIQKDI